jgi:hypothetical protein
MIITDRSLSNLEGMRGIDKCQEIGDLGERLVSDVLVEHGIPHMFMESKCHIDIMIPSRDMIYGVEVKTFLTARLRVMMHKDHGRPKKAHCQKNGLKPITVVVRKILGTDTFDVLWKKGIREFELDRMKDFDEFIRDYQPPIFYERSREPFRCPKCGEYAVLGNMHDRMNLMPVPIKPIERFGPRTMFKDVHGNWYLDSREEYAKVNILCACDGEKKRPAGWILKRTKVG